MRKKKQYKQWVYQHPEKIYLHQSNPDSFEDWLHRNLQDRPLMGELGMGTGDFLVSMAKRHPEKFFIGIEVKADRVMKAFRKSQLHGIANIAFLRTGIEKLDQYAFPKMEKIFLFFPDPWPKKRHLERRLTQAPYLRQYQNMLAKNAALIFKTDDENLFSSTLEIMEKERWKVLRLEGNYRTEEDGQTAYERRFIAQGKGIFYLEASPPQ